MAFQWDSKNNFILSYFVAIYQQQRLSTSNIDWSSIANDISLEISSTPILLKEQYEYLLKSFHLTENSKSLHSILKYNYLHSLCEKLEENLESTLETVYELIRHARSRRIHAGDIKKLIEKWKFRYSSDKEQNNKNRLLNILNRLVHYIDTLPKTDYPSMLVYSPTKMNEKLTISRKEIQDDDLELVSESDNDIVMTNVSENKQNQSINIDKNVVESNKIEKDKFSTTRRRTKSLTLFDGNKNKKVNVGVEWFVPKLKRQQRSSSFHVQSQSESPNNSSLTQDQNLQSNKIDNNEYKNLSDNPNIRRTQTQPTISWLPLTDEQIAEKEYRQKQSRLIDNEEYDQISSSDSEPRGIQQSFDYQQENSSKRQRLS